MKRGGEEGFFSFFPESITGHFRWEREGRRRSIFAICCCLNEQASWNSGCRIHTHDKLAGGDDDDFIKPVWGILCHTRVNSVRRSLITDLFFLPIFYETLPPWPDIPSRRPAPGDEKNTKQKKGRKEQGNIMRENKRSLNIFL